MYKEFLDSPIGRIHIEADTEGITGVYVDNGACFTGECGSKLTKEARRQLEEYFAGRRTVFEVPLHVQGTSFQQKVWQALREIPYGETRSYGQIAERIGNPKACRAVGMANHKNPIMILIPCHRVVGGDGRMVGYGGGIPMKQYLLKLENAACPK